MPTKMSECVRCQVTYPESEQHSCLDAVAPDPRTTEITLDDLHNMVQEIRDHLEMDDEKPPLPKTEDNWRHRAENMRCRTCMWYVPKSERLGRCRFNAPTIKGWPAMFPGDWCGQHKLDEDKI